MVQFLYGPAGEILVGIKSGGGSGGTSSADESAFTPGVSLGTPAMGTYQVSPRTLSDGQLGIIAVDSQGRIVLSPAGGSAVTLADGADVTQGAIADAAVTGDSAGTVNAHLRGVDKILADVWDAGNHWLKTSIQNSTLTVVQATAANLNATVIGTGTFAVQVSSALPTGTNVIGHVITDTGSTTAVTGNVTVVNGGTFAVQITAALPTGGNVIGHVIADSGSTTAVTGNVTVVQGTPANLKAQVTGAGTAGSADAGVLTIQGIASMTKLLVTPDANSAVNVAQIAGTATSVNSGTKDAGTQREVLATDQPTLTNLLAQVSASGETNTIYAGTTALTPKWATITASTSGANTQVAAVTSKHIRVIALAMMSSGAVNVKFQSHVSPTDLTGLFYLIANTGFVLPKNENGWFQTVAGEALDINLSGSVGVGGVLQYVEVS